MDTDKLKILDRLTLFTQLQFHQEVLLDPNKPSWSKEEAQYWIDVIQAELDEDDD